jgi:hypothetical protein
MPSNHWFGNELGLFRRRDYCFGDLYDAKQRPGPITDAAGRSHGRRNFFVLANTGKA